jgi:hypothetical protein
MIDLLKHLIGGIVFLLVVEFCTASACDNIVNVIVEKPLIIMVVTAENHADVILFEKHAERPQYFRFLMMASHVKKGMVHNDDNEFLSRFGSLEVRIEPSILIGIGRETGGAVQANEMDVIGLHNIPPLIMQRFKFLKEYVLITFVIALDGIKWRSSPELGCYVVKLQPVRRVFIAIHHITGMKNCFGMGEQNLLDDFCVNLMAAATISVNNIAKISLRIASTTTGGGHKKK